MSEEQGIYKTERIKAYELTGHINLLEAFEFLEAERQGMKELHDLNNAQAIVIQRLYSMTQICTRIATLAEEEDNMFTPKLHQLIEEFKIMYADKETYLQEALKLWKK